MDLKTYCARSVADALGEIKKDLGADAVILHTRTFKRGGFFGIGAANVVEITASSAARAGNARDGRTRQRGRAAAQRAQAVTNAAGSAQRAQRAQSPAASAELLRRAYSQSPAAQRKQRAQSPVALDPAKLREAALAAAGVNEAAVQASRRSAQVRVEQAGKADGAGAFLGASPAGIGPQAGAPKEAGLYDELSTLKRMVGAVLQRAGPVGLGAEAPEALVGLYMAMLESELDAELADEVVAQVRSELSAGDLRDERAVRAAAVARLASFVPSQVRPATPGRMVDGRPLTLAFVGPTGVGKTTTIAKLAAAYKMRHGKKVGLIASDTYRIAAVEQLRTYANIIGLPIEIAGTPREMGAACDRLGAMDVVLVDTAGRSQHDGAKLTELRGALDAAKPHETHLVLAGCASEAVCVRAAERFAEAKADRVIFTKLDEAVGFGAVLNAARRIGAPLSYITTGQEVPDQIEPGRPERLAKLVLAEETVR